MENTCNTIEEKTSLYWELQTGAETGWDYSSRWLIDMKDGSNHGTLKDTKARPIIPVDPNSILAEKARIISNFYRQYFCNQESAIINHKSISENIIEGIENVLWNEEEVTWFRIDLLNEKQRPYFTPSYMLSMCVFV